MRVVGFASWITWHFLWQQEWCLIKWHKCYPSTSKGDKRLHHADWIKYIIEILQSLGKITESYICTCKLTEIRRNVLFQSHFQALNSRYLEVKVSVSKSDFTLGSGIFWTAAHHLRLTRKFLSLFARLGSVLTFCLKNKFFYYVKLDLKISSPLPGEYMLYFSTHTHTHENFLSVLLGTCLLEIKCFEKETTQAQTTFDICKWFDLKIRDLNSGLW